MMITSGQAFELFFILCAILVAAAMISYAIGIIVGEARALDRQDDEDDSISYGPSEPDLTIRLKHVAPSTAQLFRQLEQEAGYQTTPLGQLVQPGRHAAGHPRYGHQRTTDAIATWTADTDRFIAQMGHQ